MATWRVEIEVDGIVWVDVEADDEEAAKTRARDTIKVADEDWCQVIDWWELPAYGA